MFTFTEVTSVIALWALPCLCVSEMGEQLFDFARSVASWGTDMSHCCDLIETMAPPSPIANTHTRTQEERASETERETACAAVHTWNSIFIFVLKKGKTKEQDSDMDTRKSAKDTPAYGC